MTNLPTFSVVIPTYNRGRYIGEAIESVFSQTLPPAEIIVVDDGSTDNTQEVLAKMGSKITCLRVENGGVSRARNIGIRNSRSDWVGFLDSDDTWEPQYLATQSAQCTDFPEAIAHLTNSLLLEPDGPERNNYEVFGLSPLFGDKRTLLLDRPLRQVIQNLLVFFQTAVVRRQALERAGLFAEDIRAKSDLHLMARLALLGSFSLCRDPLVLIRRRRSQADGSISVRSTRRGIETQQVVDRILSDIAALPGLHPDEHQVVAAARSSTLRFLGNLQMRAGKTGEGRRSFWHAVRRHPTLKSVAKLLLAYTPRFVWSFFDRKGQDVEP